MSTVYVYLLLRKFRAICYKLKHFFLHQYQTAELFLLLPEITCVLAVTDFDGSTVENDHVLDQNHLVIVILLLE